MGDFSPNAAEVENSQMVKQHCRRNFCLGVANGALCSGGLAFSQPSTILPLFVSLLTGSNILIGLSGTITIFGGLLPQLALARYLEGLPRKIRLYGFAGALRLAFWLCLAVSVLWIDRISSELYLVVFFACLASYSLLGGVSNITFLDIVGKSIDADKRGRYFGYRRFFSGIIAIVAGVVVAHVLGNIDGFPFPKNYFVLFVLTFFFLFSGITSFLFVVEPPGPIKTREERASISFLSQIRRIISEDRNMRRFLYVLILSSISSLSIPFYVIYAKEVLGASGQIIGLFVTVGILSALLSNIAWGFIGDTRGHRFVLRSCTCLSMLAPIAALLSPNYYIYSTVFALNGSALTGIWLAKNGYLLGIAPEIHRPTYIGIMNTFFSIGLIFPIIGGIILDISSFKVLFTITSTALLASVCAALTLKEQRFQQD